MSNVTEAAEQGGASRQTTGRAVPGQTTMLAAPGQAPLAFLPPDALSGMLGLERPLFAFDLDGTVTSAEILPRLAACIGLESEMSDLTARTLSGEIPFEISFRRRFAMLRQIPLRQVHAVIGQVPLDRHIENFILEHVDDCVIVTGNLDVWIAPLLERLGCRAYCSLSARSSTGESSRLELARVLDKGQAVRELKARGRPVVAVGESVSDIAMFREADLGLAFAGVHQPVSGLLRLAGATFHGGEELCVFLRGILRGGL